MILYLFLLLPFSLAFFIQKNGPRFVTSIFIGVISSLVVCGINAFFITATHIIEYSFKANFLSFLVKEYILPVIIMFGLFLLISRDSIDYKIKSFFPLICSFYLVYMPFFIIKGHSVNYSFYELFVEPTLILTMISTISVLLKKIFDSGNNNIGLKILYSFIICAYLIIPVFIQTLFTLSEHKVLLIILSTVYILPPFTAYIFRKFFDIKFSFFPIQ